MSTKLNIPLSSTTKKLQAAVNEVVVDRDKLRLQINTALADDKTPLDKATEILVTLRAKQEINDTRLAKRRPELLAAFVADVRALCVQSELDLVAARENWQGTRLEYREALTVQHKENEIKRLVEDPALTPKSIRTARNELDIARNKARDVMTLRDRVDKEHAEMHADTLAASPSGTPYRRPVEWYMQNAGEYIPELADEAPKAVGVGRVIGKAEVFRI